MKANDRTSKIVSSAGVVAAMLLAVLVNVIVARHYKRWDVTRGGLYTLSDPTLETLHGLHDPVKIYVLLPSASPLTISLSHLLESYRAETTKLEVELADPDKKPAEFLSIQQRYGVLVGKTDEGEVVTDASVIVVRGDKPFFLIMVILQCHLLTVLLSAWENFMNFLRKKLILMVLP